MPVRAGLHTGECERMNGKVGGLAVHIGARVASLAGSGEIVLTSTVRDLATGSGLPFADRGTHSLKGVPREWQVFAVEHEDVAPRADDATENVRQVRPGRGRPIQTGEEGLQVGTKPLTQQRARRQQIKSGHGESPSGFEVLRKDRLARRGCLEAAQEQAPEGSFPCP